MCSQSPPQSWLLGVEGEVVICHPELPQSWVHLGAGRGCYTQLCGTPELGHLGVQEGYVICSQGPLKSWWQLGAW